MRAVDTFTNEGLTFDVVDRGPAGGRAVLLLHGFPGDSSTWDHVVPRLHALGYRTLAPDQRGYSPRARPPGREHYVVPKLVDDAIALLDQAGVRSAHVVGHDWGGVVAWFLAAEHPTRVATANIVSTPHPRAFVRSLALSTQAWRSSYALAWQAPILPELSMLACGGRPLHRALRSSGLPEPFASRYVEAMREPGRLTAALEWYRAVPLQLRVGRVLDDVEVPTMYVWSTGDAALGRRAAELTARYVDGPYRFEVLDGAPHWIPEACAFELSELLDDHLAP
jgi:pimeloyl-ACP methyl ester carboxylesterase